MFSGIFSLITFLLEIVFLFAFIHAFITHLIVWYNLRLQVLNGELKPEDFPWFVLIKSLIIETLCNFVRFVLYPFGFIKMHPLTSPQSKTLPILLVHGYLQNQLDWLWFRKALRKFSNLGPVYTLNLGPAFASITELAEQVKRKVAEIREETKQENIILVGHSMGGLVSSYYAELLAPTNEVKMIIALGSPFQGTTMAAFGIGENVKEMAPNSAFLKALEEKIKRSAIPYYCVASKMDNLIVPWQSALLEGKSANPMPHLILEDHGHLRLLVSNRVVDSVAGWISTTEN